MRRTGWRWILPGVLSVCAFAQQGANGGTEAAIRSLERAWAEGQSRNDNGVLDLIFDNSLVYVEYGKLVSEGEYLLRVKSAGSQMQPDPHGADDGSHFRGYCDRGGNLSRARSERRQGRGKALALHGYVGEQEGRLGADCGGIGAGHAVSASSAFWIMS